MARGVNRGEIWMYQFSAPDKRRPVLVLSRQDVIGLLHTVMVAPVTSVIRGAPSEVVIGVDEGLKTQSAVNLDHVQTVERSRLERFVGHLSPATMRRVCRALAIAVGCDE
ncbi:MAG: type II toxin-antitoxin system PemK/MazF family toxin [Acidobacteriota bacterium]